VQKILFLTNIPSPYRVDFFNELGKMCELTVCYERESAGDRDTRWHGNNAINYTAHFTKAKHVGADKTIGFDLIREIKKVKFDHLIISGYASPSVMLAITYCRIFRIPYAIEGDGGFFKVEKGIKRILKKFLLCGAQSHFTTCQEYTFYLLSLGISKDKINKYPFTSLKEQDIVTAPASDDEKHALRTGLGITEDRVVLSVGQFIYRKGFDVLINAAKGFPDGTGTYIIGGIPGAEYIEQKERLGLESVHFVDFKSKDELKKWYRAADVFVLPTREDIWGLVINEAMAQGLPVVTTDKCIAGLELVDDSNGAIVPTESVDDIVENVSKILSDEQLMHSMSVNSIKKIREYTIEKMAEKHRTVFEEL